LCWYRFQYVQKNKFSILFILWFSCLSAIAQIGGNYTYQFLTVHPNARIAALGGLAIATPDNDLNLAAQNPAMLRADMHNQISYSHVFLFSDIQSGYVAHARHYEGLGTFAAGIQYISYGNFQRTASNGESLGTFTAGEYAFQLAYSKKLDEYFSIGGQIKLIYSSLAEFNSFGGAIDAGITYHNPEKLFTASLAVTNFGTQFSTYTDNGEREKLPTNLMLGMSKKLQNAPFRFTLTGKYLNQPGKLLYQNANKPTAQKDLETGETIEEDLNFGKQVMSHVNANVELLFGKNFYFGLGYNYLRRWEMGLKDLAGGAGFSWGFGLKISKFQLAYGNISYFVGNSTDHLTVIFNINDFKKKKSEQ
jgi:hypothetical protein